MPETLSHGHHWTCRQVSLTNNSVPNSREYFTVVDDYIEAQNSSTWHKHKSNGPHNKKGNRSSRRSRILFSLHFSQLRHSAFRAVTVKTMPASPGTQLDHAVVCKAFFPLCVLGALCGEPARNAGLLPRRAHPRRWYPQENRGQP